MVTRDGCRVLVVDDNPDNVESLAMLLGLLGHEVETARDGLEAVAMAKTFQPDVVLLDIALPKLDGYQVAERIRADRDGAPIHLVAISGWDRDGEKQRAEQAGFDRYLTKPVDPKLIESLIESLSARK